MSLHIDFQLTFIFIIIFQSERIDIKSIFLYFSRHVCLVGSGIKTIIFFLENFTNI